MATWKKRKTGGSWPDEEYAPICTPAQQKQIINAYDNFISSNCLDNFPGIKDKLREKWDEIEISCDDDYCSSGSSGSWPNETTVSGSPAGHTSGNSIIICPGRFGSAGNLGATLLHEMVHAIGGKELDCEAVEWNCFFGNGAGIYDDWDKFKSETSAFNGNEIERIGEWAIWNSNTGEVWGIIRIGGSWPSGDEKTKGNFCFQSNDWKHTYPDSGGGWP
jgi:hypothetical protein